MCTNSTLLNITVREVAVAGTSHSVIGQVHTNYYRHTTAYYTVLA